MFLIFTPEKKFWKKNVEYIFAGQWCTALEYEKKNKKNIRYINSNRRNKEEFEKDFYKLDEIYEKYLNCLYKQLNQILSIDHSKTYWRILLGLWLKCFIDSSYDRFLLVQTASRNKSVKETWITTSKLPPTFLTHGFNQTSFNYILFSEIMSCFCFPQNNYVGKQNKTNKTYVRRFLVRPCFPS